jgi:hypothetical protein
MIFLILSIGMISSPAAAVMVAAGAEVATGCGVDAPVQELPVELAGFLCF